MVKPSFAWVLATGCAAVAHAQPAPPVAQPPAEAAPARDELLDALAPLPDGGVAWPEAVAVTPGEAATTEAGEVRYEVTVEGLEDLSRFKELSVLWQGRGAPANLAQINRRVFEDRDLIDQLLRSRGRYGGTVEATITPPAQAGAATQVVLTVEPGPVYTFAAVDLTVPAGADATMVTRTLGIAVGDPVDAAVVGAAEDGLKLRLADAGYPFPTVGAQDVAVDHETRTATLTQAIDPGRRAVFGRVRFAEATRRAPFDDEHLAMLARLDPGEAYNAADLEDLRRALIQTGLVGSASIKPEPAMVRADGTQVVDLVITTEPAPQRTIAAQFGYSTGQGLRLEGSWQHRNLLPPEGAVTVRGVAAEREQLLGVELRRRNWRKRDQSLLLRSELSNAEQDAFFARTLTLGAAIERETNIIWQKKWAYSFGAEIVASSERDRSRIGNAFNTFLIVAAPLNLTYDGSDNLLDPTRGFRLTGRVSPEVSYQDTAFTYVKLQLDGTAYQPFGERVVIAARAHAGTIAGASRGRIAPTRRFYAGGGGSVRGFSYQQVGPMDADGRPLGGNSLTEFALEARVRFRAFGNDLGIVPFVDAGQVSTGTVPKFDALKVGAGLGLRYYTSFGPVRIDLATPLNGGSNDPKLAFYVSIGQAF
ncbi:autotransporter assembly complex protein TamA [Glacieibacterium frigidum]|uniref:Outer membrane protein assembly factor n=1 Tax=Glacieibacterium frigidum TaxID=2593303 RepID=A0A552UI68_9SPHN|nr:autotransporter assembly complex family protein [Glacieibacterium frigidum]TRW17913.1 outer membrane protein assembly factor [Glacieibacterium frigidum]